MNGWKETINNFARQVGAECHPMLIGAKLNKDNCFTLNNKLLVIKVSLIPKPWWGLHTKATDKIKNENGFLVLLVSENEGWVLTGREVRDRIENESWRVASDEVQYKIHRRDLPNQRHFSAPEEFLQALQS
ncbi:MAG TPA: hypothetical protein VKS22_05170 [Candidatus Binataceae bacterium]|nr:hypothetical protein [Candidatus Binataceae bacterium]